MNKLLLKLSWYFSLVLVCPTVKATTVSEQLGWVQNHQNLCGGYYQDTPFCLYDDVANNGLIQITGGQGIFSLHGQSVLQGKVTITRLGQQITADQIALNRDAEGEKIHTIDLLGNINLREPNNYIFAEKAHLDLLHKTQSLENLVYRTAIYTDSQLKLSASTPQLVLRPHQVAHLSAWGQAKKVTQRKSHIYEFEQASYSTCPPIGPQWQIKASRIVLDKNTGRGTAKHARLYVKNIPVLYTPYFNFPIDSRRQTGFLIPQLGAPSTTGAILGAPFYWNIAENLDDTLTPAYSDKRGWQLVNLFRYLTPASEGQFKVGLLPNDKRFRQFQRQYHAGVNMDPQQFQANLARLESASTRRGALSWQQQTAFDDQWASHINYNYVSDDYYLRDVSRSLNEVTENQLLQQADITYQGKHWNFTGRVQQYQTLHPVDQTTVFLNQYSRFPQLTLNADYPEQKYGINYFATNELTHFDIRNTPGTYNRLPMGNRLHVQPGASWPLHWPFLYITPRIQLALTQYDLKNVSRVDQTIGRALPIFDVGTNVFLDRETRFLGHNLHQTLEPQIYYTYIPMRDQIHIPIFDTTLNTLTYNQLFTYNRFSGLDRFGDSNQIALGIMTRLMDPYSGLEQIKAGIGEIIYFKRRAVTLCTTDNPTCLTPAEQKLNRLRRSPVSGMASYHLNQQWSINGNTIWNTQANALDNQNVSLQYQKDPQHVVNLGYNFVRNGDILTTDPLNSSLSNLKQVDVSFAWPVSHSISALGRWIKSINRGRFQNQLYGLQYDSCCWAVRLIAGRTFTHLDPSNNPQYDTQLFVQFALRGLANISPAGDPSQLLGNIPGYNTNFGQNF